MTSLSNEEIAELAAKMKIADPNIDNGSFDSMTHQEAWIWLKQIGVSGISLNLPAAEIKDRLQRAFWDSQRIDCLFHGSAFGDGKSLDVTQFPNWPDWKEPHSELNNRSIGSLWQSDGFKDAKRLNSYVFRHFALSAFNQMEHMNNIPLNVPQDIRGGWIGTKKIMSNATLDLTGEGGDKLPFVSYYTPCGNCMFIEFIEVKQCTWPEPSAKFMGLLKVTQNTKFGHPQNGNLPLRLIFSSNLAGPLVPMLQTPKFPLLIIRYAYFEGRPKDGSQFLLHLEGLLEKNMKGASSKAIRDKLQWHLGTGEQTPPDHLRMFARLLSYNSTLIDPDYMLEMQSHWNVSKQVANETKISFFVPCLRLRWRELEEIEMGIPILVPRLCGLCGGYGFPSMSMFLNAILQLSVSNGQHINPSANSPNVSWTKIQPFLLPSCTFAPAAMLTLLSKGGFAVEQEAIKVCGLAPIGDCPPNEYGDERFLIRATMPPDRQHAVVEHQGKTVIIFDRRRSLQIRTGPGDPIFAQRNGLPPIPLHIEGHKAFTKLVREKGIQKQVIFLWARRIGDTLEIDLEDLPPTGQIIF